MKKFFQAATLIALLSVFGLTLAEEEKKEEDKPKPDYFCIDVCSPEGVVQGGDNKVRALITNLVKDSRVEGKIKVELVVIQADPTVRDSYFLEIDAMAHKDKKEALFTGVQVKNPDYVKLLVIVDPEKVVEEANEDNNRRLHKAWVKKTDVPPQPSASPSPEPAQE